MKKKLEALLGASVIGLALASYGTFIGLRDHYQEKERQSVKSEPFSLEKELNKAYDHFINEISKDIEDLKKAVPEAFDPKYDPNTYTPMIIDLLKEQGRYDPKRDEELHLKLKDNPFNVFVYDALKDIKSARKKYYYSKSTEKYLTELEKDIDIKDLPKYEKLLPWKIQHKDGSISEQDRFMISVVGELYSRMDKKE